VSGDAKPAPDITFLQSECGSISGSSTLLVWGWSVCLLSALLGVKKCVIPETGTQEQTWEMLRLAWDLLDGRGHGGASRRSPDCWPGAQERLNLKLYVDSDGGGQVRSYRWGAG
jgi:hypothetical protein